MTPIRTLLIANRGEIACAIIDTARRMGMRSIAVYSEADAKARHVRHADEAVLIGAAPARDSYLNIQAILAAAKAKGADAIHPGYGFLSENAGFAEAMEAAGLSWVGPPPAAIRAMGMKDAAKRLMEKAGVPVVPGYHGEAQDIVVLAGKANEIGYPVMIKAAAGGGGRGMRLVEKPGDFREALASAKREAKAAFSDDRVLVEKFIANPRHIEVQVFGDAHGNIVHLFERDCSLQRRHQKVIEEAPAPGMTPEVREAMTAAALKAANAIGYCGAGTIEFIVDGSGPLRPDGFWFMEMNTRLQVEHRVTQAVTGVDLIEWQLRVAQGEPLPKRQDQITLDGHAIEARIYAEDPAHGFMPSSGRLARFSISASQHVIDAGYDAGDTVPAHYDAMLGKIIVRADSRSEALNALADHVVDCEIAGVCTNLGFIARLARHADVIEGRVSTGLIENNMPAMGQPPEPIAEDVARAVLAAADLFKASSGTNAPPMSMDPWDALMGFTLAVPRAQPMSVTHCERTWNANVTTDGASAFIHLETGTFRLPLPCRRTGLAGTHISGSKVTVFRDGFALAFTKPDPFAERVQTASSGRMTAPMPGIVKLVAAKAGAYVKKGDMLLILEAMKMEHRVTALRDGIIAEIVMAGAQVKEGSTLAAFTDE
jgi:3-methylcrotonyl-CoA carboxylase alpha subunit